MKQDTRRAIRRNATVGQNRVTEVPAPAADVMDMAEAIAALKTSRPTFYRLLRTGKLKGMKVGRQWRFYRADIARFLEGEGPRIAVPVGMGSLLEALRGKLQALGVEFPAEARSGSDDQQAVALMIHLASSMRASDLHLEAHIGTDGASVAMLRLRVDGVMHTMATFDLRLLRPLIARWKVVSGANINEERLPQDCRLLWPIGARSLDMRICFVPACMGEVLTARLLDSSAVQLSLDHLDLAVPDLERLKHGLRLPWGLLVVSGPTGSGKTTVLYACLNQCASATTKCMSVEDPIEYILPWVTQLQVRPALGMNVAAMLRAVLRSDPDVIMVGELRDAESLRVTQQTALTGHLVMTTMHTDEAAAALTRMAEIGGDPFLVAESTKLVLAQRLVRVLCKTCSRPVQPPAALLARAAELAQAGGLDWEALPQAFREPVGCPECRQTGYRGRKAVTEALVVTPEIGTALRQGASVDDLRALAIRQGMTTFVADGIRRAAAGQTALDEVMRLAVR